MSPQVVNSVAPHGASHKPIAFRAGAIARLALFVAGGLTLVGPGYLIVLAGRPTLWAPSPFWMVLWALGTFDLWFMVPAFLFWLLGLRLALGRDRVSIAGLLFQTMLGVLNLMWLVSGWDLGLRYQGALHTTVVSILSVSVFLLCVIVGVRGRKNPSYRTHYVAHWLFCFWLVWVAFPYLGELF